jgi:hypothetical protein
MADKKTSTVSSFKLQQACQGKLSICFSLVLFKNESKSCKCKEHITLLPQNANQSSLQDSWMEVTKNQFIENQANWKQRTNVKSEFVVDKSTHMSMLMFLSLTSRCNRHQSGVNAKTFGDISRCHLLHTLL